MNKKLLILIAMMLTAASSAAGDEDSNPSSTSLNEEVLGSSDSSSISEDMDATAELLLNVEDLEYEDDEDMSFDDEDEESSDDEEGVRRYLRANMGRRLQQLTKTGYKCDTSCMSQYKKCRNRCKVVAKSGTTRCINGVVPGKCKKNCCQPSNKSTKNPNGEGTNPPMNAVLGTNGIVGTPPYLIWPWPVGGGVGGGGITTPQLPYCPNFTMHTTGMGPCMATQFPIPGVNACPSGTLGTSGGMPCIVW